MQQNKPQVRVGVGVMIYRGNNILLGLRKGAHGEGTWALPGGHLEFGESIENCAIREVMEETGLTISNITKIDFTNDIFEKENKHYITIFVKGSCESGDPKLMEPNKCTKWQWFSLDHLPEPLFLPLKTLMRLM